MKDFWDPLLSVIVALITAYAFLYVILRIMGRYVEKKVNILVGDISPKAEISKEEKGKEAIRRISPKTFYYLDEVQVRDLYPQVLQEAEPIQIQSRETKGSKGGIGAKLKLLAPSYEKRTTTEVTKKYDVRQIPSMMYNRVEQHLVESGKVTFGLEDFEFDESSVSEFKSMCDQMRNKFSFEIPQDLQRNFISDRIQQFALKRAQELAASSGYVTVQSEFSVSNSTEDSCVLSFIHPLNKHLEQGTPSVTIDITCAKRYLTTSGINAFKGDNLVKITCLGKVVSWNGEEKTLKISPIAIY